MIFVVPAGKADQALRTLARGGKRGDKNDKAWVIGEVVSQRRGKARVEYR